MRGHFTKPSICGYSRSILVDSLANKKAFYQGAIFSRLQLSTDCGEKTFTGLSKTDGKLLFNWLRSRWLEQLAPDVTQAADAIRSVFEKGYPRQSRLDQIAQWQPGDLETLRQGYVSEHL